MNQNSPDPSGSKNYPANNYIPKSNPNSRPKKFTKYAYVVKNKVAWDKIRRKNVIVEGQGQQEAQLTATKATTLLLLSDRYTVCMEWSYL